MVMEVPRPPCRPCECRDCKGKARPKSKRCPLCPVFTGEPKIIRNMGSVALEAWRTNHRFCCRKCGSIFLGGPGSLSGHEFCPKCGHAYWVWETWKEVNDG